MIEILKHLFLMMRMMKMSLEPRMIHIHSLPCSFHSNKYDIPNPYSPTKSTEEETSLPPAAPTAECKLNKGDG